MSTGRAAYPYLDGFLPVQLYNWSDGDLFRATYERRSMMDESTFNLEIRKFLKTFGVNAQREIEKAVRARILAGDLSGEEMLGDRITLDLPDADLRFEQQGTIALS